MRLSELHLYSIFFCLSGPIITELCLVQSAPHVFKHVWLALKLKMQEEESEEETITLAEFEAMTLK